MTLRERIIIDKADDREAVVQILARNGYTVRIGTEKNGEKSKKLVYVEYWRE